ncbi:MAG: efflux RND transporter periplasmic adaptor subunit [Candidatus Kapabacteria bacterium]|nr:efflux RND transporter periplasmic adaptor subunit [Candidatus Kapabacteria bacterium]
MVDDVRILARVMLVAIVLLVGCSNDGKELDASNKVFVLSDTMMKHIRLDTANVETMHGVLYLTGHISADENKLIEVYPFVGGTVTRVKVELGDHVKKQDVLAVIRSGEVAEYERQLIDARSDVAMGQKNLSVQKELLQSRLSSDRDVVAAQRELSKAQADLQRIEEIYRIYSINNNSEYVVRAPISGYVIRKDINNEMTLRPDRSTSIFTIAELDDVWVLADVYENDISKVSPGMLSEITTVAYPDSVIHSNVDKVFNMLDDRTRTMSVRMKLPNTNAALKPGMAATVKLLFERSGTSVAVPSSSIIFDDGKSYVVIYHDRRNIEVREVTVSESVEGRTYISSGLQTGEVVVSKGQLFLYDALTD